MDLSNISDLDCPQYVQFESESFLSKSDSEEIPTASSCSLEPGNDTSNMNLEKEGESHLNSYSDVEEGEVTYANFDSDNEENDVSISSCSLSNWTTESLRSSVMDSTECEYSAEEFPIIRPNMNASEETILKRKVLKTTVPKPFHLKTDKRIKGNIFDSCSDYEKKDFVSQLRQNITSKPVGKGTKVQPFHLTESKKRKHEDRYLTLAEQVAAFQSKTPKRFHSTAHKEFEPMDHWVPPPLDPKSPQLKAVKRCRTVTALSKEELEEKEVQEMKGYKFHALPFDPKIFEGPSLPKVDTKPPTKPLNLVLRTALRAEEQYKKCHEEPEKFEFHARPVPTKIFKAPAGLKKKAMSCLTHPKSPAFSLKGRMAKWRSESKLEEKSVKVTIFKAHPVPPPSEPFSIQHQKKTTEIEPFSFDSKDKERFALKQQKIQEEIEKENMIPPFKAQPVPGPDPSRLPPVQKIPVTHPEPFRLTERNSKCSNLDISQNQSISFKAQPATVLKKQPFIPEKPPKFEPEIKEFHLHTEIRATERQQQKILKEIEENEKEKILLQKRAAEEEKERLEIIRLRKETVHKANPIRHYKNIEITHSTKSVTKPVSPKFATDERLQSKQKSYEIY